MLAPRPRSPIVPGNTKERTGSAGILRRAVADIRRLLAGEPLPDTRDGRPPPGPAPAGLRRWLTIHINLDHLRALATHQACWPGSSRRIRSAWPASPRMARPISASQSATTTR
mgnify:CR=1 FL=1